MPHIWRTCISRTLVQRVSLRSTTPVLMAAIFFGCGGGSDSTGPHTPNAPVAPPATATLSARTDASQSATVATAAASNPTVLVTDTLGAHPSGIIVTFTPDSGAGSVAVPSVPTDASGLASSGVWTIGTRAQSQRLTATATVDGTVLHTTFTVSAQPGPPATLKVVSGGAQDGPYGATLVTPVQVLVADKFSNPTAGAVVQFSVDSGGVTAALDTAGADGTASTRIRLPQTPGRVVLLVTSGSIPSVTTTLTSRGIRFASFSLNGNATCGLSVEGYPYCWGGNSIGQLTPVTGVPAGQDVGSPHALSADLDLTSLSLDNIGGCGLRTDGIGICWGDDQEGQNGDGHTSDQFEPVSRVAGDLSFVEIQRGNLTTCGTTKTGESYCWGRSVAGEVGAAIDYLSSTSSPLLIDGGRTFHSYALGTLYSCALDPQGQAYCWGSDLQGRLGVASASVACGTPTPTTCAPSPVAVETSVRFASLVAEFETTCGLDANGATYCWGGNDFGALGNGGTVSDATVKQVQGVPAFKQLSGHDRGFCGLTASGDIYCWGLIEPSLGVASQNCGTAGFCTPTPTKVQAGRQFSSITFTTEQLCGVSDGVGYCWGNDSHGALGIGVVNGPAVSTPTQVAGQAP
jgi:alpha-tubulin suppressor-like RCC1 family protein